MERDMRQDLQLLTSSYSWRATPWDYSSLRFLRFQPDATAELVYGYGQTIYAIILCQFAVSTIGVLRLTYLESPAKQYFTGYTPQVGHDVKELRFTLTPGTVTGVESIVAHTYIFQWTLTFDQSPYPDDLVLPYDVPLVYYGHEVR
jgi:hypothetical protein